MERLNCRAHDKMISKTETGKAQDKNCWSVIKDRQGGGADKWIMMKKGSNLHQNSWRI